MRKIQYRARSESSDNIDNESYIDNSASYRGENPGPKEILATIKAANNQLPLASVLKHYGVKLTKPNHSNWSQPILCPFLHNGIQERTPSFGYNFVEDRFYCFGCQKKGRAVEFIAVKENKNRYDVALGIIGTDADIGCEHYVDNSEEIENLMFEFSSFMNKIVQSQKNNPEKIKRIKTIQWVIDCYIASKAPTGKIDKDSLEFILNRARDLI